MNFKCKIGEIDWAAADRMKYWTFAKNYKGDSKAEARNMVFSGEYLGALKRDGYWAGIYKNMDGEVAILSRSRGVNGEYANHYDKVPHLHSFFDELPNGTVLIGELYLPSNEGSKVVTTILGCLTEKAIVRQKEEKLHLYIFDVWAWDGASFEKKPAIERFSFLMNLGDVEDKEYKEVEYAIYYSGSELWNKIQEYLSSGREGVVITHKTCPVYFKRTPARKTLKIKKEVQETIDCFFTGRATAATRLYTGKEIETWTYWENTKTGEKIRGDLYEKYSLGEPFEPITKSYFNGWAGSLEIGVYHEGKIRPIGYLSGLTEEMKANPLVMRGQCIEVTCMEIGYDENGKFSGLRHAKLLNRRPDLKVEDCTWDKFME